MVCRQVRGASSSTMPGTPGQGRSCGPRRWCSSRPGEQRGSAWYLQHREQPQRSSNLGYLAKRWPRVACLTVCLFIYYNVSNRQIHDLPIADHRMTGEWKFSISFNLDRRQAPVYVPIDNLFSLDHPWLKHDTKCIHQSLRRMWPYWNVPVRILFILSKLNWTLNCLLCHH